MRPVLLAPALRIVLDRLRDRSGARTVQFSSDALRGGNHLYLWQWAYLERTAGRRADVLRASTMRDWTGEFPLLDDLTIDRSQMGILDQRQFGAHFSYGEDFDIRGNADFCRALIASSPTFRERCGRARDEVGPETCVVNVRRGDYYSVPEFTERFALDIAHHVEEALEIMQAAGRSTKDVLVVSDDVEWCRAKLPASLGRFRTLRHRESMFDDLAALAVSRSLVLANSTFSYWGSYLATALDTEHLATAPSHHERTSEGELLAAMFDPRWHRTSYQKYAA